MHGNPNIKYINILVCFEVRWDLTCFLRPWKHLLAAKIRFWISSLMPIQTLRALSNHSATLYQEQYSDLFYCT